MLPANIKEKIVSTYGINKGDIELEARFGQFNKDRFSSGVTRQVFNRIKSYFDSKTKDIVNVKTTDYIMGRVRKTIINPEGEDSSSTIWITKNRLWNIESEQHGIRYSMSSEIPIEPIPEENFSPTYIREKNRSSYLVFGKGVQIDITLVTGSSLQESNDVTYEVEIELLDRKKLKEFEKAVEITLRLVLDTIVLYNNSLKGKVVNEINSILGSTRRGLLDYYPLVQARNLKLRDMVYGGLIGNENTGYSVTNKADGQRRMLVFLDSGIWLVASPDTLTRVTESPIPALTGTILDGEMIPKEKRLEGSPKAIFWYLAFDTLAWNRDKSIQNDPHGKRMFYAQTVADALKGDLITVNTKTFKNISTPQEFFKIMREMFREQISLPYKQDGFMFTPQNTVYNPHSDKHPLYTRSLTKYPDICKWKPKDELTIDFLIKWKTDSSSEIGRKIELYAGIKGEPVIFQKAEVDQLNPLTLNLPNNTIVEYRYDYDRNILVPTRIRHDKEKPNKMDIAEDVWLDISMPIEKTTMEGDSFTLLRRYHNRIKKELFNKSLIGNEKKNKKCLLDIGSGRGGDINKWKGFDRIVAVEPNSEHIVELKRRLEGSVLKDKVFILQSGGEETEKIQKAVNEWCGGRVDVISSMLSLTFFWQSSSLVDSLSNTILLNIKPKGKVIFLTMDGNLVEQTFEPAFGTGLVLNKLKFGNIATLDYFGDKKPKELHIHIEDSIVSDQTEWLVRLDDFLTRMGKYGFSFTLMKKADEEKFLTEEEITMTQMYTYGILEQIEDKKLPEIEDLNVTSEVLKTDPAELPPLKTELPKTELPSLKTELPKTELPKLPPLKTELPKIETTKLPSLKTELPKTKLPPLKTESPKTKLPSLKTESPKTKLPSLKTESPKTESPKTKLPPLKTKSPKTSKPKVSKEKEKDMLKMDDVEILKVTWWDEKVVRIGSMGDGSCYFHSLLNAYLKIYQINPKVKFRKEFVKNMRRDVSLTLSMPDPLFPDKTRYETAANGQFVNIYEQQLLGLNLKDVFDQNVDFSIEGLARLFDSNSYLGDEIYSYVADLLNIDVYVMRLTDKDLYVHLNTHQTGRERKSVVISGNGYHFETIGIERNGLYQTFFLPNDPFILKIQSFSS